MLWLWAFWIEALALSFYVLWYLITQTAGQELSGYQWADIIIYGITFVCGLYGSIRFARRRLASGRETTSS
jgi:hypothetical protein